MEECVAPHPADVYSVDMAENRYAEAARERKAHHLWSILRDISPTPTDSDIRVAARTAGINRPSDATCLRVRQIAAASASDVDDIFAGIETDTATELRPAPLFTAVLDTGSGAVPLRAGTFLACRQAVADAFNAEADRGDLHPDYAAKYRSAARAVRTWKVTAPTSGPNWEMFVYRFAAQITSA